ncbi:MAG: hypothetical protein ACYTHJ_16470 [Planctomycetota bacterium]|jgi:hypothetical protein
MATAWLAWASSAELPARAEAGAVAGTAEIVFDNAAAGGGLDALGASPASQRDTAYPFSAGAVDDFVLPASPQCLWNITSVQWTGVYWNGGEPGSMTGVRITIWPDTPDGPAGGGRPVPDHSQALVIFDIAGPAGESPSASGISDAFDYAVPLPAPFSAIPGQRYWIEIQPTIPYPPQWGVHVTHSRVGAAPVRYFDLLQLSAWSAIDGEADLGFKLLGLPGDLDCNDGNACTTDSCANGQCVHTVLSCDDGNACTADSCDAATGCNNASITCDDQDMCTTDSCDPASGCQFVSLSCDDGNACTADSCSAGACVHSSPPDSDGDADVDLADYKAFLECMVSSSPDDEGCSCSDFSGDGLINLRDFGVIQNGFNTGQ